MKRLFHVFAAALAGFVFTVAPVRADEPADKAIKGMFTQLSEGKTGGAWSNLPKSYQEDIEELVEHALEHVDAEVWNKGFAVVNKTIKVLREKKEFVLGHPALAILGAQLPKEDLEKSYEPLLDMIAAFTDSDLADHSKAKDLDMAKFAEVNGGKFMAAMMKIELKNPQTKMSLGDTFKSMKDTKVELVSSEGDTATVKVSIPGAPEQEMKVKKIEGKWVQQELVEGWDNAMKQANDGLEKLDKDTMSKMKPMLMGKMGEFEKIVDEVGAVKSAEDFLKVSGEAMEKLGRLFQGG